MPAAFWAVPREWPGQPVFIIGGGPSVAQQDLRLLRGRRVIVINSSYQRVLGVTPEPHLPGADILFFADSGWWLEHRTKIDGFAGRIVTTSAMIAHPRVLRLRNADDPSRRRRGEPIAFTDDTSQVPMRRTSFAPATNLAFHLNGGAPIVWLGADGQLGPAGDSHHHPPHHGWHFKQDRWPTHHADLAAIAAALRARGVTLINASPGTAWADLAPVMDLREALAVVEAARVAA